MPDTNAGMPIEWHELLRVEPESITDEIRQDMEQVWRLVQGLYPQAETLACAAALLANVMGSIPEFNPISLPFGYGNPDREIKHSGWVLQKDLERIAIQILGLAQPDQSAEIAAVQMCNTYQDAVSSGLLESHRYDSWRPGMASGAGWTKAYHVTPYGVLRARRAHVRSNGFHPEPSPRSQQSPPRIEEEKRHPASAEPKAAKQPVTDMRDANTHSGAFIPTAHANASVGDIIVNNTIQIDPCAVAEKVLTELSKRETVGETPDEATGVLDTKSPAAASHLQPGAGMPIAEVIRRAEEYVRAQDGDFPGRNKFAKIVGCSRGSITKAVERSTYLKARKAEHEAARRGANREVQVGCSMDTFTAKAPVETTDRDDELDRLAKEQEADQRRDEHQRTAARRQYKVD